MNQYENVKADAPRTVNSRIMGRFSKNEIIDAIIKGNLSIYFARYLLRKIEMENFFFSKMLMYCSGLTSTQEQRRVF